MGSGAEREATTADVVKQLQAAIEKPSAVARNEGDAAATIAKAARKIEAVYEQLFACTPSSNP
ncbi:MAG: hypothetical protein U1E63_03930 [Burkholderiales bacterium]